MTGITINHATVRQRADMLNFLELCAARDVRFVSIWGDEIEKVGQDQALARMQTLGLTAVGYNRIGPFDADGLARAERDLERAALFGCDHVFLFTGGLAPGDKDLPRACRQAEEVIAQLLELARGYGVKLALEPLHPMMAGDRTVFTTLAQANDLCDRLGTGIGVVVDVHHVWWDPCLATEIARAGKAGHILGFHVNDWLVPTRDMLQDRGMMGDGVIDLAAIEALVRGAGYDGPVEVEIFSKDWAERDPAEVIDIAIERCHAILHSTRRAAAAAT